MTWLKKSEPTEAWEIEDEGKIGDLKLASQIREICNSVADSAEAVSVLYYGPSTETKKRQIEPPRDCRRLFCLSHAATAVSATMA